MVAAVVAKAKLVGFGSERQPDQLVPEADAKNRGFAQQLADVLVRIGAWLGVPRTIREKYSVRTKREHVLRAGGCRNHGHAAAMVHQHPQNVLLDAKVIRHHVALRLFLGFREMETCASGPLIA